MSRPSRTRILSPPIIAAAALLASGFGDAPTAPAQATEFGVHIGGGCDGRRRLPEFERFAGRKVERVVDALDQRDWARLRSSVDWASRCWAGAPMKLTLSIPMLTDAGGTLREGAGGAYDGLFLDIARALVRDGHAAATIRLGWEFNGNWMPWRAAADPENFIAYYRRIVRLMRSVPGQRFQFEWTTAVGRRELPPDRAYPGDDVVDIIGMDVYNEQWSQTLAEPHVRFAWLLNQPYGMAWLKGFAAAHRKPTAYSEWGSGTRADGHGAGDDPYFFRQMAAWFKSSGALYQSYWEVRNDAYDDTVSEGRHPRAAAAFRTAFGGDQPR